MVDRTPFGRPAPQLNLGRYTEPHQNNPTTVVSYYTSKPSRDIIVLAHQEITRQWWPIAMRRYNVFISEVVIEEASFGDPEAAKRRLEELKDFPHLELNDKVEKMAQVIICTPEELMEV